MTVRLHRDEHGNPIEHYHLCGCRPIPLCDAYHGGLVPPEADIDFGRRLLIPGIPGKVRFLCDFHGRGMAGSRNPKFRLTPMKDRAES